MNPERLVEIRALNARVFDPLGWVDGEIRQRAELLTYVDELAAQNAELRDSVVQVTSIVDDLKRQVESARSLAVKSGIFQNIGGTAYLPDVHLAEEDKWRADPVGPVAWDRQVQQR